jgi:hypothetical protein
MAGQTFRELYVLLYATARLSMWLAIFAAIFVPIERIFALHSQKIFRKEIAVDLGYYFLNGLLPGLVLGPPISVAVLAVHHFIPGGVLGTIAAWPIWLKACATMLVGEIAYYWAHRLSHQIPFLWRFHAVHHSAEHLDFSGEHAHASRGPGVVADDHADPDLCTGAREPGPLWRWPDRDDRPPFRIDVGIFHPFQHPLAIGAVRMASDDACLSPLAPHQRRQAARLQLRVHVSLARPRFRHPPLARSMA